MGSTVIYESYAHYERDLAYSPKSKSVLLFYRDESISGGRNRCKVTTSGNTTSVDSPTDSVAETARDPHVVFDTTNNRYVLVIRRTLKYQPIKPGICNSLSQAYSVTNLTVNNFVGISNGAYADGATATIQTFGAVDDAQSGLTAGKKYYVQSDGSLGLNETEGTGTRAGIALSATKLLISGN